MYFIIDNLITTLFGDMTQYLWWNDFYTIISIIMAFLLVYGAFLLMKAFFGLGWLKW